MLITEFRGEIAGCFTNNLQLTHDPILNQAFLKKLLMIYRSDICFNLSV